MTSDDMDLLREYARHNSEEAFATLVSRHLNLVYSVGLRQLGDAHLAEEVAQAVFVLLARKADSLGPKTILPAWLCRTAHYAACDALRAQRRRQSREQEAYMRSQETETGSPPWTDIAPLLDAALAGLREKDHSAVVLRFFESKDFKDVGAALGVSENAARKRVAHSLEKLRLHFSKRGVALTTAGIASVMLAHSVKAAPAPLAQTITHVAMSKGVIAGGSTSTLIKGALKIMAWSKAKTAVVVGVVTLVAIGTPSVMVMQSTPNIQGAWVGTLTLTKGMGVHAGESPSVRLVAFVTQTNGAYDLHIDNIDSGRKDLPVSKFTYKHHSLHAESMGEIYDATVNLSGTLMTGTYHIGKVAIPVTMIRTKRPPPFPEPLADDEFLPRAGSQLQGYWSGGIGPGKKPLGINIKVAEATDGTFRADFYVPTQGGERQPTTVTYDGTTVRIMPMSGYGMFEGTLDSTGRSMQGDWLQGGRKTPTTLTRAN